ncbi:hypothetical protein INT47_004651, partial [Mucor saturninus]
MAPPPLDIKLEVILDNANIKYFPGDAVEGKIFITSNQNYSLTKLRLAWTGRISVQPIQSNRDNRTYFDECWKLGSNISKSATKTAKGSSQVPYYNTHLVSVLDPALEPKVDLAKNKTMGFAFKVYVPNDRPLPSSTEGTILNKIIYLLEAFIDQESKPVFFAQRVVPVYEAIYTRTPEMIKPQRAEQVFVVSLSNLEREFTSAMRVTLPCHGCQAGIAIPVSITIWNNMEFSRKQGISISLFRVNHVIANGRAYTSPGEKVHRIVADLNITSENNDNNQHVQTVRAGLPIPKGTMPTISLEQSELLSVSYFIRVQIFAQEGTYTTAQGTRSQFMMVDIPFIIGTLTAPNSPTSTAISSPRASMTSPRITSPMITSPRANITSPRQPQTQAASPRQQPQPVSPRQVSPPPTNISPASSRTVTPVSSPRPVASLLTSSFTAPVIPTNSSASLTVVDKDKDTDSIAEKKNKIMSGVFRKSSSGSTVSSEEVKKKRGMFSTLRLYGRNKSKQEEITPTVVMTPKQAIAGDTVTNDESQIMIVEQKEDEVVEETKKWSEQRVFKMFDDSDSEDEEAVAIKTPPLPPRPSEPAAAVSPPPPAGGVFNMFPDSDDDDEEEGEPIGHVSTDSVSTNQRLDSSHVFKMFDDDDSDEEDINQLSISRPDYTLIDERVKPHEQKFEYKPNVKEYAHLKPD